MRRLTYLAGAALAALAFAVPAEAVPVLQIAQTAGSNTITGTANGGGTATTISGTDVAVAVTQNLGGFLGNAFLDLTATSIDAAVGIGAAVLQHYSGNFAVTSLPTGGVNILSGTFTDSALGVGPALGLTIGAPPDTLSLTSDLINPANLQPPLGLSFSLTNVTPGVHITGTTLASFSSSVAGNVSANAAEVPEPASLAILGVGLIAAGALRGRRSWLQGGSAAA